MPIVRLIVISGPKASGKSRLMECLRRGEPSRLAEAIDLGDPDLWQYAAGADFQKAESRARVRESTIERLVLHYEFTGPWNPRYYADSYATDRPLELLRFSQKITHVVLWAPVDVLLNRFLARNPRFRSKWAWLRTFYHLRLRIRELDADFRPLYQDSARLRRIYEEWLEFCRVEAPGDVWLANSIDDRYRLCRLQQIPEDLNRRITEWTEARKDKDTRRSP